MKTRQEISTRQLKVLRLNDDFALFSNQCAFLCDAFASIPARHEEITPATLGGLEHYSHWLKTRLVEIKTELGEIHAQLRELKGL